MLHLFSQNMIFLDWIAMLRRSFGLLALIMTFALPLHAFAGNYDVPNIQVTVQAKDAVQARDQAITQAQRQALAVLVGRTTDKITNITDDQIARLISNFSVQG